MPDLGLVGACQAADHRRERGGPRTTLGLGERLEAGAHRAERVLASLGELGRARRDERLCGVDDLQRARLALVGRVTPRGDAVPTEDAADRLRVGRLDRGDVQAELEPGTAPGHPHHPVAEHLAGQRLAVGGGRERDPGVGVQVVHVRGVDQRVHRGVDARRRTPLAVQAEVEGGDHLVLALEPRVHPDERPSTVQAEHGQARLAQRAQVTARALDPHELDRRTRHRVGVHALGRRVAPGVVGVTRVGAQAVGTLEQLGGGGVGHDVLSSGRRTGAASFGSWCTGAVKRPSRPGCPPPGRRRSARGSPTP